MLYCILDTVQYTVQCVLNWNKHTTLNTFISYKVCVGLNSLTNKADAV